MNKENKYIWISLLFVFIQALVTVRNFQETFQNFFWFCDFASILLAFGFYFKNVQFVKAVIHIGLIPQVLFILGLLVGSFTGIKIIATVSLSGYGLLYGSISILIHAATLLALYFTLKEKPETRSLLYSVYILTGMYLITILFTPSQDEFNYVFSHTSLIDIHIPFYLQLWIPIVFIVVVLPTYLLEKAIFTLNKKILRN